MTTNSFNSLYNNRYIPRPYTNITSTQDQIQKNDYNNYKINKTVNIEK
ncbi:MAG: hypothetical protein Faunusvirus43_7, partial [Faunusvirus sp.]